MSAPEERLAAEAAVALRAQVIREGAIQFVDLMADQLIERGHFEDRTEAYREVAVQATFNSTVLFESLPDPIKHIFKEQLLAANGG